MKESFHISDLIVKKIRGQITEDELRQLDEWIQADPVNREAFKRATDPGNQRQKLEAYKNFRKEKVWSALEDELFQKKTISFNSRRFLRYAAAILLPVLVAGGAYLFVLKPSHTSLADLDNMISPGSQRATLILSDGGSVALEGDLAPSDLEQGKVRIRNADNRLSYTAETADRRDREVLYNELRTPRGGSYSLQLADGTTVWLNAGSSLRFPVSFTDSIREVWLEGEAYFEVTSNGKPFEVNSGSMGVRVLGTSFNVSAYPDEYEFITTLVEGRVRVDLQNDNGQVLVSEELLPDRQAILELANSEIRVEDVNTTYYTSWMHGKIEFDREDLDMVMKELARWYDFDYRFENREAMHYHFTARLDREAPISSILEMLEMTTDVKFDYKGGTIVIH